MKKKTRFQLAVKAPNRKTFESFSRRVNFCFLLKRSKFVPETVHSPLEKASCSTTTVYRSMAG